MSRSLAASTVSNVNPQNPGWPTQLVVSALHAFGTVVFWADELVPGSFAAALADRLTVALFIHGFFGRNCD